MPLDVLDRTIALLYQASSGTRDWLDFQNEFDRLTGSFGTVYFNPDRNAPVELQSPNLEQATQNYISGKWSMLDERYRGVPKLIEGHMLDDTDICSEEHMARSPFYQDFIAANGLQHWLGRAFRANGKLYILSAQRRRHSEPFLARERQLLESLVPHLSAAFAIGNNLQLAHSRDLLSLVSGFTVAAYAINTQRQVIERNDLTHRLEKTGLQVKNGKLVAASLGETHRIESFIDTVLACDPQRHPLPEALTVERPIGKPLVIRGFPVGRWLNFGTVRLAAIVVVIDPETAAVTSPEILQASFGLSGQEARFASMLASGMSVTDIAQALQLQVSSTRQILKSVLNKTGCHRQSELVAHVSRLVFVRQLEQERYLHP